MKIFRKGLGKSKQPANEIETSSWRIEYNPDALVFHTVDGKTFVVEGDLYYYLDKHGKPVRFKPGGKAAGQLKSVYDTVGEDGFAEHVEGFYNTATIDKEKDIISIRGDAFNRRNLFYSADANCAVVATEYQDVLAEFTTIKYEPAVLCCMMILGYPPLKHTPYSGLHRLAVGEKLLAQNGRINRLKAETKPLKSIKMNDAHLQEYAGIYENAILSRASRSENWASISGGWDSTIVLGTLCKFFDTSKVRAVVSEVKLKDGRVFNPYEVDKAVRIGRYYGVPTEVASINFADANLKKLWNDTISAGRTDFVYTHTFLFKAMVDTILAKGKADAAVFIGSLADSLHNFGFSQGVSLLYLNNDFRNYSDKMMSYLYSPSFLRKVIDDTYLDDFAYNLFKNAEVGGSRLHHAEKEFTPASQMTREERIFEYLLSFVLSISRLPFAPIANEPVFSSYARASLKEWLYVNYFKEVVTQIDTENMYFWLIWLYQHFHLQGFEKGALNASLRGSGRRPCVPFYDLQLVKFLQRMPENWGRGLEWRHTKYPLIHYGRNILKVPYDIIESGVHSYITETEQGRNVNIFSEVLNNSVLSAEMWQNAKNNADLDKLFDKDWFDLPALKKILEMRVSKAISALPLRLLLLLSIKA